ncbi:MAG: hypothetical protein M1281_03550 [Chloroflexi bacterium]|nr:hypothetical protein [Chloroflexota bacterium]
MDQDYNVPPVGPAVEPPPPEVAPKKNNTIWIVLAIVLILLCCCCLVVILLLYRYGDQIFTSSFQTLAPTVLSFL